MLLFISNLIEKIKSSKTFRIIFIICSTIVTTLTTAFIIFAKVNLQTSTKKEKTFKKEVDKTKAEIDDLNNQIQIKKERMKKENKEIDITLDKLEIRKKQREYILNKYARMK